MKMIINYITATHQLWRKQRNKSIKEIENELKNDPEVKRFKRIKGDNSEMKMMYPRAQYWEVTMEIPFFTYIRRILWYN